MPIAFHLSSKRRANIVSIIVRIVVAMCWNNYSCWQSPFLCPSAFPATAVGISNANATPTNAAQSSFAHAPSSNAFHPSSTPYHGTFYYHQQGVIPPAAATLQYQGTSPAASAEGDNSSSARVVAERGNASTFDCQTTAVDTDAESIDDDDMDEASMEDEGGGDESASYCNESDVSVSVKSFAKLVSSSKL